MGLAYLCLDVASVQLVHRFRMAGRRARRARARYQRVLLLSNSSSLVEVKSVCQLIELRAKKT